MDRSGNGALIAVLVVAVGIGAVVVSPAIAGDVLPGAVLVHHPQFEGEEAGVTCDTVERVEEGEETLRDIFGAEDDPQTGEAACSMVCGGEDAVGGDYCGGDDVFTCVCQVDDNGVALPLGNQTDG